MKIIGEISGNHRHEFEHCSKLIHEAKIGGFTHVKFQTIIPNEITVPLKLRKFQILDKDSPWYGRYLIDLYEETAMSFGLQAKLIKYCNSIGIKWLSSPFSSNCVDFLEEQRCPVYKIASFEATDKPILESIAKTGKPIIMSTGGMSELQIEDSLAFLRSHSDAEVELLYCVSEYPANIGKFNLGILQRWSNLYGLRVGLSDHSEGCIVSPIFVSHGARTIEKHIKLEGDTVSIDAKFSLSSNHFTKFTDAIYAALHLAQMKSENHDPSIGQHYHRSYYFSEDITKGTTLEEKHLISLRPSSGLTTFAGERLLGRKFKHNVNKYSSLTESDLE